MSRQDAIIIVVSCVAYLLLMAIAGVAQGVIGAIRYRRSLKK